MLPKQYLWVKLMLRDADLCAAGEIPRYPYWVRGPYKKKEDGLKEVQVTWNILPEGCLLGIQGIRKSAYMCDVVTQFYAWLNETDQQFHTQHLHSELGIALFLKGRLDG